MQLIEFGCAGTQCTERAQFAVLAGIDGSLAGLPNRGM
jgi:hypothetical protein